MDKELGYEFIVVGTEEGLLVPEVQECYGRNHVSICVIPGTTEQGDKVWVIVTGACYTGEYDYLGDWYDSIDDSMEAKCISNCVGDQIDPRMIILSW